LFFKIPFFCFKSTIYLCLRRPGTFSRKGSWTSKSFW